MRRELILRSLGVLEFLVAIGAIAGGATLVTSPLGEGLHMPLDLLKNTPFRSYLIPGLILCFVVGGSNLIAGWLSLRLRTSAPAASAIAGGILSIWIAVQIAMIGYLHMIQVVYLAAGVVILGTAVSLTRAPR